MQKKRTETDVVRTKFWLSFSCTYTKQGTAFKLGRLIEPETYTRNPQGGTSHNNKFSKYESGKHTPHPDLVNKMEFFAPGSMYVINMPLWKALQPNFGIKERRAAVNQLPRAVTSKINGLDRFMVGGSFPKYTDGAAKKLVRMGTYDALCMLLIFWRFDDEDTNHPNRIEIAVHIYRLLLILSGELFYYKVRECFFSLFKHQVFDLARSNGYRFDVDYEKFCRNAELLNRFYPFERATERTREKRSTAIGMTLQKSSKNFELHSLLNDVLDYDETMLTPSKVVLIRLTYTRLSSDWAFKVLCENHRESLIDTIKNYVKNNSNLTEPDEKIFIFKARIGSMKSNI